MQNTNGNPNNLDLARPAIRRYTKEDFDYWRTIFVNTHFGEGPAQLGELDESFLEELRSCLPDSDDSPQTESNNPAPTPTQGRALSTAQNQFLSNFVAPVLLHRNSSVEVPAAAAGVLPHKGMPLQSGHEANHASGLLLRAPSLVRTPEYLTGFQSTESSENVLAQLIWDQPCTPETFSRTTSAASESSADDEVALSTDAVAGSSLPEVPAAHPLQRTVTVTPSFNAAWQKFYVEHPDMFTYDINGGWVAIEASGGVEQANVNGGQIHRQHSRNTPVASGSGPSIQPARPINGIFDLIPPEWFAPSTAVFEPLRHYLCCKRMSVPQIAYPFNPSDTTFLQFCVSGMRGVLLHDIISNSVPGGVTDPNRLMMPLLMTDKIQLEIAWPGYRTHSVIIPIDFMTTRKQFAFEIAGAVYNWYFSGVFNDTVAPGFEAWNLNVNSGPHVAWTSVFLALIRAVENTTPCTKWVVEFSIDSRASPLSLDL